MTPAERIEAARAWHQTHVADRAALEARLAEVTERWASLANLFSPYLWGILPAKIKTLLEEYRS